MVGEDDKTAAGLPEEEKRLLEIGRSLRGQAHGVKNFLSNLAGGLYVLQSGLKNSDQTKIDQGVDMISRNSSRLTSWFERLSAFGKGYPVRPEALNPGRTAREVASDIEKDTGIPVRVTAELSGKVELDPRLFKLALGNLIQNGAESIMEDGPEGADVLVRLFREDGALVVEVTDGGPGLSEEARQWIWKRSYSGKSDHGGLGLLEVLEIARVHGGRVLEESPPEGGARFRLELALSPGGSGSQG